MVYFIPLGEMLGAFFYAIFYTSSLMIPLQLSVSGNMASYCYKQLISIVIPLATILMLIHS
jgi:hypothetical protein